MEKNFMVGDEAVLGYGGLQVVEADFPFMLLVLNL